MKRKTVERKFFTRIISIVIGLALWAIIIYTEDANFDTTIKSIPIQISGESILTENDLIVANRSSIGEAVISVRGKRSDIIGSMGSIYATADVSKIEAPGRYNIKLTYELATNALYITRRRVSSVEIVVEKAVSKEFELEVIHQGTNPNSGVLTESVPEKKKITVKGTAADIAEVKHMAVYVDISEMLTETASSYPVTALDEQYRAVKTENELYREFDSVNVLSTLHSKRTLPVEIVFAEEDRKKYAFEIESVSAKEIEVGAAEDVAVSSLRAVLDYNEETGAEEYVLKVEQPEGVYIPENSKTVTVRLKAYPMKEQYVTVPLTVNAESDKDYSAPAEISIRVCGAEQYLNAQNITAEADIIGLETGQHNVEVKISFAKEAMYLPQKQYITISVR